MNNKLKDILDKATDELASNVGNLNRQFMNDNPEVFASGEGGDEGEAAGHQEEQPVIMEINDAKDGQTKCPKCGATDISMNTATGQLRCNFCRHEFKAEVVKDDYNIADLEGIRISTGAQSIIEDAKDVITLKCESCGAEVVIDTASSTQARCHWCRNTLSINQQIPNGAVPDMLLPFKITRQEAEQQIEKFVSSRKFFAHPTFTKEFTLENVNGVYFPYMVIDINAHAHFQGEGEIQTRKYTRKSGDDEETYYDANVYHVEREFDIAIDDLTIEASSDKLMVSSKEKTTNIINSIMPFDTENCVKYDANYMKGYTSEKRDTNTEELRNIVHAQSSDIARFAAKETCGKYDRGVRWEDESFNVKGESWKATQLPVWLYSYLQTKGDKKMLHYVAVNARTQETMGSVPINFLKLGIVSAIIEIFGALLALILTLFVISDEETHYQWLLLLSGFIFYGLMYLRYRNADARHTYELETKREVANMRTRDDFIKERKRLRDSEIRGRNDTMRKGDLNAMSNDGILTKLKQQGISIDELAKQADRLKKD